MGNYLSVRAMADDLMLIDLIISVVFLCEVAVNVGALGVK